jgi:hypothetical protein
MNEQKIAYEPHPVSIARKAELRAQGFIIIDAIYAPKDPPPSLARPEGLSDEATGDQLRAAYGEKTRDVHVHVVVEPVGSDQMEEVAAAVANGVKQHARNRARNA